MTDNNEDKKEESTPADAGEGVQPKAVSDLDRADEIVERRNRVCEREEKILERKETLEARKAVGGVTEAGGESEKPKEETPEDYAKKVTENNL